MNNDGSFKLETQLIGSLPLVNHFIGRIGLDDILRKHLDTTVNDRKVKPAQIIGVLLRNIILDRTSMYDIQDWAHRYRPDLLGLDAGQLTSLNDDRIGRDLDMLFDADRASLLTEIVVRTIKEYKLDLSRFHNDATTITFTGRYKNATGEKRRGKDSLNITFGHNKDHRPDLKQLMWFLTVSSDGAVPIHYKVCDGNTSESPTYKETWDILRRLVGRPDFIYVADSKLCTSKNMKYIDEHEGCFITVLPRTRREDGWFREYIQAHQVVWEDIDRSDECTEEHEVDTQVRMVESPIRSSEGFRIVWVWDKEKEESDALSRQMLIEKAVLRLEQLETRLRNPRNRLRSRDAVVKAADNALGDITHRWIYYMIKEDKVKIFKQEKRGRPSSNTIYKCVEQKRFHVSWHPRKDMIDFDMRSDGMFPLITNCDDLPLVDILDKYKYQPWLEKRHQQLKTVYKVAPVFLKSITRIEGLLFIFFLGMLVQALIEREVRFGMKENGLESISIYPEDRDCESPTTSRLLSIFDNIEYHRLWSQTSLVQIFQTELSVKQKEILRLAGVPVKKYELNE
ncbi:MAG: IS1634 family transposase [Candidatus Thermoplasmatota archaeon]|nr:IS1634 family transposase [Candidatus Thermoplasmatota archaeon]